MIRLESLKSSYFERGIALVIILGALLIATGAFIGFFQASRRFLGKSAAYTSQVQTDLDSQQLADRTRREVLRIVQEQMINNSNASLMPGLSPQTIQQGIFSESNERILAVRCIGQGSGEDFQFQTCTANQILPKVFELRVQSMDPSTQQMRMVSQEIQINNAAANNYAFYIKNEDREIVSLGSANYSGLFGINFTNPLLVNPSNPTQLPKRILLRPTIYPPAPLVFQKAFITNLPNPRSQFDINDQSAPLVQMPGGVVSTNTNGLDFGALDAVHARLKADSVNIQQLQNLPQGTTVNCSRVTLMKDTSTVRYQSFSDANCTTEIDAAQSYAMTSNQAIHAMGERVLLATEVTSGADNGMTRVDNIAIIADGNVELRSPIRRNPNMDPLNGYPAVLTHGDLVISQNMTTLLPGSPTLAGITSNQSSSSPTNPTIEVDLSYLAIARPPDQNGQNAAISRVVVDPALFGSSSAQAINLGRAKFNGMYISDKAPTTRLMYGSTTVDGFGAIEWNHPPALAAVMTDWFSAQLGGGALQAFVVKTERSTLDLSKALTAFDDP